MLVAGYDISILQCENKGSELGYKREFRSILPVEGPVEPEVPK